MTFNFKKYIGVFLAVFCFVWAFSASAAAPKNVPSVSQLLATLDGLFAQLRGMQLAGLWSLSAEGTDVFDSVNTGGVSNGPTTPTIFTLADSYKITAAATYHWNNGAGKAPGTISLINNANNSTVGTWSASGNVLGNTNTIWVAYPNVVLQPGTYKIVDSDNASWSQNSISGGKGIAYVKGVKQAAVPIVGSISVSVSSQPVSQNVVGGTKQFEFARYLLDASWSKEDVLVRGFPLKFSINMPNAASGISANCNLYDGTSVLWSFSSTISSGSGRIGSEALGNYQRDVVVPKATAKTLSLKCDVPSGISGTISWGIDGYVAPGFSPESYKFSGVASKATIVPVVTASAGPTMTITSQNIPAPNITSVAGKAAGNLEIDSGGTVFINGSNLAGNTLASTKVYIGGMVSVVTSANNGTVVATAPASLIVGQSYDLYISNERGQSNTVRVKVISSVAPVGTAPTCRIMSDKTSYKLGDNVVLSWNSTNATSAFFVPDPFGKDTLVLPGDKLLANGSQTISANVIGNPRATLKVVNSATSTTCTATFSVEPSLKGSYTISAVNSGTQRTVTGGQEEVLAQFNFTASPTEDIYLKQIAFQLGSPLSSIANLQGQAITIWDGQTKIGTAVFTSSIYTNSTIYSEVKIAKGTTKTLTVKGIIIKPDLNNSAGGALSVWCNGDSVGVNGGYGLGVSSGQVIESPRVDVTSAGVYVAQTATSVKVELSSSELYFGQTYNVSLSGLSSDAQKYTLYLRRGDDQGNQVPLVTISPEQYKGTGKYVFVWTPQKTFQGDGKGFVIVATPIWTNVWGQSGYFSLLEKTTSGQVNLSVTSLNSKTSDGFWQYSFNLSKVSASAKEGRFTLFCPTGVGGSMKVSGGCNETLTIPSGDSGYTSGNWLGYFKNTSASDGTVTATYAFYDNTGVQAGEKKSVTFTVPAPICKNEGEQTNSSSECCSGLISNNPTGGSGYCSPVVACKKAGESLGAVYYTNTAQCCAGLIEVPVDYNLPPWQRRIGGRGTCMTSMPADAWKEGATTTTATSCKKEGELIKDIMKDFCCSGLKMGTKSGSQKWCVVESMEEFPTITPAEETVVSDVGGVSCTELTYDLSYRTSDSKTNGEVTKLQEFLSTAGYLDVEPTGYFGALTVKGVRKFQSDNGINQTGGVGPATRQMIKDLSCNTYSTTVNTVAPVSVPAQTISAPAPVLESSAPVAAAVSYPKTFDQITVKSVPSGASDTAVQEIADTLNGFYSALMGKNASKAASYFTADVKDQKLALYKKAENNLPVLATPLKSVSIVSLTSTTAAVNVVAAGKPMQFTMAKVSVYGYQMWYLKSY